MDILTKALGNPEHPGRVRAMGQFATMRETFGPKNSGEGLNSHQMEQLLTQVREQTRLEMRLEMEMFWNDKMQELGMLGRTDTPLLKLREESHLINSLKSGKGSSPEDPDPLDDIPKVGGKCRLCLEDPTRRVVAHGWVYKATTIHTTPLLDNQVKVVVDEIIHGEAELPFPTDEATTVEGAHKQFIAWPRKLVELVIVSHESGSKSKAEKQVTEKKTKRKLKVGKPSNDKELGGDETFVKDIISKKGIQAPRIDLTSVNNNKFASTSNLDACELENVDKVMENESPQTGESAYQPFVRHEDNKNVPVVDPKKLNTDCLKAFVVAESMVDPVKIHMHKGIVSKDMEYSIFVPKDEILRFLAMATIDISCIQLFMVFLHSHFALSEKNGPKKDLYGFLCPHAIQSLGTKLQDRMNYVGKTLKDLGRKCYFAPYIEGPHWMLCAVCTELNIVYWFDSKGGKPRKELKHIVNTGLQTYHIFGGKRTHLQKQTKWICCPCRQQIGDTECGYYVMRYMYEIITLEAYEDMDKVFATEEVNFYSPHEIDLIRGHWCTFLFEAWRKH